MVKGIKKSGLTLQEAQGLVDASIREVKDGFVATGYYLWRIREERLWEEGGYRSFREFLQCQYQKDKSWASRCIGLYEQFGKTVESGELPVLAEPYRGYSVSQLIEMVSMTEEEREQVTPEMKVREIRERKPKREKRATGQKEARPDDEEPLPGQACLEDYPAPVATVATGESLDGDDAAGVCAYREGFFCSLTREQQKVIGGKGNCHVSCCWGCASREGCKRECASSASRGEESAVAAAEPLSAHGTPRKKYPENSLMVVAGCEREPGGPQGGYACFCCARECGIRQKDCYCVDAPLGNPFPCERMDIVAVLQEAMGDRCPFVNLDLAYHRPGDGEPVPCCKECVELCEFRCARAEKIKTERRESRGELEESDDRERDAENEAETLEAVPKPAEVKTYDRGLLERMIADAETLMESMRDYWREELPEEYTKKAMEIQAYKNLLTEYDRAEVAEPGRADNPNREQPELPDFKNDSQRKAWIDGYKIWGLWYRDEHIDVNYYKFDFNNGSRLVVAEFPKRENSWSDEKYDQHYYHLIEHGRLKYRSDKMYEDKYQYCCTSETELVKYLKKIQRRGGNSR